MEEGNPAPTGKGDLKVKDWMARKLFKNKTISSG